VAARGLADTRNGGALHSRGAMTWIDVLPPHTLENVDASEIRLVSVDLKSG
jgi:hypothetical protein